MAELVKQWEDGGVLSVTYEGDGDGSAVFASETNEGIDRELSVTFKGGNASVEKVVRQIGMREIFGDFILADGGTFNVLKPEFVPQESPYYYVEYLQSDGSQVIDTNYVLKDTDIITLNYSDPPANVTGDAFMFGNLGTYSTWLCLSGTGSRIYVRFGHSSSLASSKDIKKTTQVILKKGAFISSQGTETLSYTAMNNLTLAVFTRKESNGYSSLGTAYKLHSMTIEDADGIKMDLRPCVRKEDGKVGLLDLVSETFFINLGKGSDFVAGQIIE